MIGSCHKHAWISAISFITTVAILAATSGWGIVLACASGMLGPVLAWNVDWVLTKRAYRKDLNHFTAFRVKAFASKMVFFGIYVTGMLSLLQLSTMPFVIGFTSSFIAVFITEAYMLKRLVDNNIKVT
tara:strand:- start:3291 stop:3674 length:384 start_codon:yes stop_codon:yes gene_type:complete